MLCVIAKLSPDVNDKLSRLRETAMPQVRFSSPLYAHITLATYLPEDTEAFMQELAIRCNICYNDSKGL